MSETAINLLELRQSFGERTLFDGVSVGIQVGDKVGLIGDNGSGKSTLLRIIAGEHLPESGVVEIHGGLRIGVLEQAPALTPGRSARAVLEEPLAPLLQAITRYEQAAADVDPAAERLMDEIEGLGGWDWDHRLRRAADEAGVEDLDAAVDTMSGGQRKRVALARLHLSRADILLLDEPTNHLDAATVEALEGWLASTSATVVVITHDRFFLEAVVDRIVELRRGKLTAYRGAYADYLQARAMEEAHRAKVRHRRVQVLKAEMEWARRSPKARTTKSRARLDRIDGLHEEQDALKADVKTASLDFGVGPRLGKTILEMHDVHLAFGDTTIIEDLSFKLRPGQRLGVVGPNGCGKTTLLRLVLGELAPTAGKIVVGAHTKPAYFDQHRSELDPAASLRATLVPEGGDHVFPGGRKMHVSAWLQRFAFASNLHGMAVAKLSGGERNRLAIARFLLADANLLLLDEPTNDLDLLTLNLFEEALLEFKGCVIVVSHDRFFLDKVATDIIGFPEVTAESREVLWQPGGYTDYLALRRQVDRDTARARGPRAAEAAAPGEPGEPSGGGGVGPKALTYMEKQEFEGIEGRIAEADAAVARLTEAYADPELWREGQTKGEALKVEMDAAIASAEALYARWADLSERGGG